MKILLIFSLVRVLFSCGADSDRYIIIESPELILQHVPGNMSGIGFVLRLSLLYGCISFNIQACPYVQRANLVVLGSLDMVPVQFSWRFF